jgi:RimJ/RimL family protein N-acetyltransferase
METLRTFLYPLDPQYFDEILEMYKDKDTFKYIGPLEGLSQSEYLRRLTEKHREHVENRGYHFIGRDKQSAKLIGILNLNPMSGSDRLFMGYQVRQHLWGQGYGKELAQWMVDFAFDTLKLTEIFALIESEHSVSRNILLGLGFSFFDKKTDIGLMLETYRLDRPLNATPT